MNRSELVGTIARGWCHPKNENKVMDPDLVEAIADEIEKDTKEESEQGEENE